MPTLPAPSIKSHLDKPCQMSCNFCYARFDEVIRDTKVKACGSITHALVIIDEAKFIARGGEFKA